MTIRDAYTVTGKAAEQWVDDPIIQRIAASRGLRVPAVEEIADDAEPVPAFINHGKWIAMCPEPICFGQAEDIWRDWPYFLCMRCGNEAVGNRWRPVALPADWQALEDRLVQRPPTDRNWHATEPGLGGRD